MVQNHTFRFRVSKSQFEKIKQEAQTNGYMQIAPFIRDLVLNRNQFIEDKIIETNRVAKEILEALK